MQTTDVWKFRRIFEDYSFPSDISNAIRPVYDSNNIHLTKLKEYEDATR